MGTVTNRVASMIASNLASKISTKIGNKVMAESTTIHLEQYSPEAKALVAAAQAFADQRQSSAVETIHLLAKVLEQKELLPIFQKMGIQHGQVFDAVNVALDRLPKSNGNLAYLSSGMLDLLQRAEKEANAIDRVVGLDNILNALTHEVRSHAGVILQQFSISPGAFRPFSAELKATSLQSSNTMNNASFTRDLIAAARNNEFGTVIGRDAETRRALQILARSTKNNPLMVGEPGAGKTAIVRGIAQRMAQSEVPQNLEQIAFIELEINALMAGTRSKTEVEDRIKQVITGFQGKDIILLIEGIENLLGQTPATNLIDTFKTLLIREEVQIFGTTTPEGLRKINEKDPTLVRRFSLLNVSAPDSDLAIEMLRGVANRFEKHHNVIIGDAAIRAAVSLAKRYVQDKALPDSAIDLLDEASARKRVEMTGVPAELDRDIQRLSSLKVQQGKLLNDNDPMGMKALERINAEIVELEPRVSDVRSKLEHRRTAVSTRGIVREQYQNAVKEMEEAEAMKNFARVGELEHAIIPSLKEKLDKVESYFENMEVIESSNVVGENDIAQIIEEWTGVLVSKMLEDETQKLLKMEERLAQRVVGQEEAVKALSKSIRRARVGLREAGKPVGSFLFLGPSGVGKTLLAKALAEFLFDDEQAMVRFDMSEFGEKHNAQRLIGSPNGYQGSTEGGQLTNAIKARPYSVLLFDEVEKAHPDVFNLFLQILDDGRLSSATGELVDFSNTIIVFTSNIGSHKILDADVSMFESLEGVEALKDVLLGELKSFLRPEFINRFDDTIIFKPLSKNSLRDVVDIEIKRLEKLLVDRDLKLNLSEKAKTTLVDISYFAAMGARPLKRSIIKKIQDPMVEQILNSGYVRGSVINVDVDDSGRFNFA